MFEAKRHNNRIATAQELYEDVAAEWATRGNKLLTWRGVRNAISKLKQTQE